MSKIVRVLPLNSNVVKYAIYEGEKVNVIVASPFEGMLVETSETYGIDEVKLLPPCLPSKIVCVGLNYKDHAEELGMELPDEPMLFLKPPSSVIGLDDTIKLPAMSKRVDHEAELAIVIGKRIKSAAVEEARGGILGYTCLNDVTARDLQEKDIQFTRSKSFDTFCPIGPWIETDFAPEAQAIRCIVNGETRQSSDLSQLINGPDALVSYISHIMTLEPGDVIATGTPSGIGRIRAGDEVIVEIEGIGSLKNHVERG